MTVVGDGRLLVVGAAVVDDLGAPTRLLAARRTEPSHLAGGWELPGGKVEPGEDPVEALHREIAEELGVQVELGAEVIGPDDHGWALPPHHVMRVWLARVVSGVPQPIEDHDELRWLGPGEWYDVGWLPADIPVVHAVERAARRRVLVLPDHDQAERASEVLASRGLAIALHRELLAGEDDAEDAQWLVVAEGLGTGVGGVTEAELAALAEQHEGWVEDEGV